LKYEEFLRYFTAVEMMKNEDYAGMQRSPRNVNTAKVKQVIAHLKYHLTKDQITTLGDIIHDFGKTRPMYRLVQGDVGCGKTAVAAIAMYGAVTAGVQCALLAPTEILARQHLSSVREILKGTDTRIEVLYSGLSNAEKKRILEETAAGEIDILIGTHSIIQDAVVFHNLGFVVADEQQRFGVEQRKALKRKGEGTDLLLMSATPIPRTLASTLYGDMDVSTIETMPPGRKDPVTVYIEENSFRSVLDEVKALLAKGRQLYVICAAVDFNEAYDARNVYETAGNIQKLFPKYHVDLLHGRMSSEEKQTVMKRFYENETQILVSTTVVEVGMNVVNATGMIIYDADRFGLSQLHQLRGRIQRGSEQGQCWLLSGNHDDSVKTRLNVLVKTNNGFEISYEDLRLRGPGDILGTRQSGVPDFILGNLVSDTGIINTARKDAAKIVQSQDNPDYIALIETVRLARQTNADYAD
jgi:ATP-dependent DNA helicase RecG